TAALSRVAVTGPPPCLGDGHETAAQLGGGFVTEDQKQMKRGGKRKIKHTEAKRGMRDVN
ncbi:hypothetical protein KI387_025229, partial [Taxus chinensis]